MVKVTGLMTPEFPVVNPGKKRLMATLIVNGILTISNILSSTLTVPRLTDCTTLELAGRNLFYSVKPNGTRKTVRRPLIVATDIDKVMLFLDRRAMTPDMPFGG